MRPRTLVLVALLAVAATPVVVAADGSPAADEPVAVENGSTYEVGATLEFDVADGDGNYELYTGDGAFVAVRGASNGTVVEDTGWLDPGTYVLVHTETGETAYEVTLVEETPTASATPTPTPTAAATDGASPTPAGTATTAPGFGPLPALLAGLVAIPLLARR